MSLKEKILAAEDMTPVPVKIPEWGVEGQLRPLDGESRFRIAQLATATGPDSDNKCIAEAYVCESLRDKSGERVFEFEERSLLAKKSPQVIERLYEQIVEISGIQPSEEEDPEKK